MLPTLSNVRRTNADAIASPLHVSQTAVFLHCVLSGGQMKMSMLFHVHASHAGDSSTVV